MKKFSVVCLLLASLFSYGQTLPAFSCDAEPEEEQSFSMFTTPVIPDPDEVFVINVFIHVITDDNGNINEYLGNGNVPNFYDEEEMMEVMYVLTKNYGSHNIFFKYRGFDVIADSDLTNDVTNNFGDYDIPGNFNLFFVNDLGGPAGAAIPGNINSRYTFHGLAREFDHLLTHEIGHCLNLWHTFQQSGSYACEHVTRDVNDPDYNADVAGDQVTDTAATEGPFSAAYWPSCVFLNVGSLEDCNGTPFANVELNYMGYDFPTGCDNYILTEGQYERARTFLYNLTASHYLACLTTVEELYEPYFVDYIQGDVLDIYQESGGTVKVCCEAVLEYRYQKGLTYEFDGHSSIPPTQDPEDWPILHPEMGEFDTYVLEFSNSHYEIEVPPYDPIEVCVQETFVSGIYYTTKCIGCALEGDGTELTQSELEDVDFYNSLPSGSYYFITRITNTGRVYTITVYVP